MNAFLKIEVGIGYGIKWNFVLVLKHDSREKNDCKNGKLINNSPAIINPAAVQN